MGRAIEGIDWPKVELAYKSGQGSCREIAEKFGISIIAVQKRCQRFKWINEKEVIGQKVVERTIERQVDQRIERIKAHEERAILLSEKLMEGVAKTYAWTEGSETGAEPSALQGLAMALKTSNAVARLNLGAVDPGQRLDVTSGGLSLHQNALEILQSVRKLKDAGQLPQGEIDVEAVLLEHDQAKQADPDNK